MMLGSGRKAGQLCASPNPSAVTLVTHERDMRSRAIFHSLFVGRGRGVQRLIPSPTPAAAWEGLCPALGLWRPGTPASALCSYFLRRDVEVRHRRLFADSRCTRTQGAICLDSTHVHLTKNRPIGRQSEFVATSKTSVCGQRSRGFCSLWIHALAIADGEEDFGQP